MKTCIFIALGLAFIVPCMGKMISYWDFDSLSLDEFYDKAGHVNLYFRHDSLAKTFHEPQYVSGLIPGRDGNRNCLYMYNLKPEHGIYPERAYVEITNPEILNFGKESFTITGWFKKSPVTAGHETLILNSNDTGGVVVLVARADRSYKGKLLFEVRGSEPVSVRSNERVDDDKWHWFATVSDNGTMHLYIDGVRQTQISTYEPGTTTEVSGNVRSRIGDAYTGCIDEISLHDEALSEERLNEIFKKGLAKTNTTKQDNLIKLNPNTKPGNEITITERILFDGWKGKEYNGQAYRLACGAVITELANGDLVAWCLTGSDNEPAKDNSVMITRSTDGGKSWSEPEIFISSVGEMMVGMNSMYPLSDGRTVAFWSYLPWEEKYTQWLTHRMYSDDYGKTWSQAERFKVGDDNTAIGRPIKLINGEYLFTATIMTKREKPLVAPVSELLKVDTEAEALALPAGEGRTAGEFATCLWGCGAFISKNEDGTGMIAGDKVDNRPLGLLEPACVQLKDGTLVMLMRAQYAKSHLWRAESTDNGRTWTDAWETDIPNPVSMPFLLRLADGRIALINNNSKTIREPLSIWISNDEMKSWYIKKDILYGGMLAYPYGLVLKDGRFVFVYDHNRRQMRFVEVHLGNEPVMVK